MRKKIKLSLDYKVLAWFAIAFITIIILGYQTMKAYQNNLIEYEYRKQASVSIIKLQELSASLINAETNQRGYIITGNDEYLKDFNNSLEDINIINNELKLNNTPSGNKKYLIPLDSMINSKISNMKRMIQIMKDSGFEEASKGVGDNLNRTLTEDIRILVNNLIDLENKEFMRRTEAAENAARFAKTMLPIAISAALIFITIGYLLIRRDMIAREKAEGETERIFRLSPDLLSISNKDGHFIKLNPAWEKTLGYKAEEILNRHFSEFLHPYDIDKSTWGSNDIRKGNDYFLFENRYRTKDNGYRWIQWSSIFDKDSGLAYSTGKDVTEARKREFELKVLNEKLIASYAETDRIFRLSLDMLCIVGFDGYFKKLNPAWEDTLGYTLEELKSKPFTAFVHPEDIEITFKAMRDLATGENVYVENRYADKNGKYHWMQWTAKSTPETELIYATAKDITSVKEKAQELRSLNERLYESYKEMESFSYSVSHDLRAPLRHTIGFTQKLKKLSFNILDKESKRSIEKIISSAEHMSKLIDDLLQFSRVGRGDMRKIPIDLNKFIQKVIEDIIIPEEQKVLWNIEPLPEVNADPVQLNLALTNLLSNAVKYTSKNEISKISVTCEEKESEFVICIKDNGVGFDMKYADKLFGVFQRLHSSAEFEGTGIGLAITSKVIQRHNGKLWAESELGKSAKFCFTLPKL